MSSGICLLNINTLPQDDLSIILNEINISVDNGDFNGDCCYMNISTESVINNHNPIDYTKKIDNISTNIYLRVNTGLSDGVYIDDMLPVSALSKYVNI